jgi:peptidyl-prolyl cis-trans isomerase A (cyclophilin A)
MKSPVRRSAIAVLTLAAGLTVAFARPSAAPRAVAPLQEKKDLTKPELFTETAPATFLAQFDATFGTFVVRVTRNWAPNAADRFYNLVKNGYYDENRFFRVVTDVLAQFGIHGDPKVNTAWEKAFIKSDRARQSNTRGRLSFATIDDDPNKRTTQVFINYANNSKMDQQGYAAFGEVTTSMVMVQRAFDKLVIDQAIFRAGGNEWAMKAAPQLSYIKTAIIVPDGK